MSAALVSIGPQGPGFLILFPLAEYRGHGSGVGESSDIRTITRETRRYDEINEDIETLLIAFALDEV